MLNFYLNSLRVNQHFRNNFATPPIFQQISLFSKYISKSRTKRMPLNTSILHFLTLEWNYCYENFNLKYFIIAIERAGKGYKKGYGGRKEGFLSSKGI